MFSLIILELFACECDDNDDGHDDEEDDVDDGGANNRLDGRKEIVGEGERERNQEEQKRANGEE